MLLFHHGRDEIDQRFPVYILSQLTLGQIDTVEVKCYQFSEQLAHVTVQEQGIRCVPEEARAGPNRFEQLFFGMSIQLHAARRCSFLKLGLATCFFNVIPEHSQPS